MPAGVKNRTTNTIAQTDMPSETRIIVFADDTLLVAANTRIKV